jgi:membrane-associated protease RseP (regulator of RpoE activity)
MIEPTPQVTVTPCTWVDGSTAYAIVTSPSQFRGEGVAATGAGGFVRANTLTRRDTTGEVVRIAPRPSSAQVGAVVASPMARMFTTGNSLAGLELMSLTEESGRAFGVAYGLFVNQVLPGTPGREAGLLGGDVLVTADSTPLRSLGSLQRVIARSRTRDVAVTIMRRGKVETVRLKW